MKRILTTAALLLASLAFTNAQSVTGYGVTSQGGKYGYGVIFRYEPSLNNYTVLYDFDEVTGNGPYGGITQAASGLFYGITTFGGTNNYGVLYSFDKNTNQETVLLNFDSINTGSYPLGKLIQGPGNLLYGMAYEGGCKNTGTLYSFNPTNGKETTLQHFIGSNGEYPVGSLLLASNGLLFGMTFSGGTYHDGTLFSYNTQTGIDSVLINFNNTNGSVPYGSLIEPSKGLLYGMTYGGGTNNNGVLFRYDILTGKQTLLVNFNGANGAYPMGSLLKGSGGILYGMTFNGGDSNMGVVFNYDPVLNRENVLFSFDGTNGRQPYGSLSLDSSNLVLYGMTHWGGISNEGVIFSYDLALNTEQTMLSFNMSLGDYPAGNLILISSGMPLALNSTLLGNNLSIYPNPAKDNVYIDFGEKGGHYLELFDITGKMLTSIFYNNQQSQLPINTIAPGIYIIKIYNEQQTYISYTKLMIQ